MIAFYSVGHMHLKSTDEKIFYELLNEYGNLKLLERIEFSLSTIEDSDDIDLGFFPEFYLARNGMALCLQRLRSLKMMVETEVEYSCIPPSMLFIMKCVLDFSDEMEQSAECSLFVEKYFKATKKHALDDEQKRSNRIYQLSQQLHELSDRLGSENNTAEYEAFRDFSYSDIYYHFDDGGDFTPEGLELLVNLYAKIGGNSLGLIDGVNLYDCVDNMYEHSRLQFESIQREEELKNKQGYDSIEEYIISALEYCIARLQTKIASFEGDNEVRISDRIADMLSGCLYDKYILVDREIQIGRAKKEIGETDIYLAYYNHMFKDHSPIAIIENKNLENFTSQYYQLLGYLNFSFSFGVTISINRHKEYSEAFKFIGNSLEKIEGPFKPTTIVEGGNTIHFIKTCHLVPETKQEMNVYHFVLNLNDLERRESALRARR